MPACATRHGFASNWRLRHPTTVFVSRQMRWLKKEPFFPRQRTVLCRGTVTGDSAAPNAAESGSRLRCTQGDQDRNRAGASELRWFGQDRSPVGFSSFGRSHRMRLLKLLCFDPNQRPAISPQIPQEWTFDGTGCMAASDQWRTFAPQPRNSRYILIQLNAHKSGCVSDLR